MTDQSTTRNILLRGEKRIVEDELMRMAAKPGYAERTRAEILAEINSTAEDGGFKVTMGNLAGAAKAMGIELPNTRPASAVGVTVELLTQITAYIDALAKPNATSDDVAAARAAWRAYRAQSRGPLFQPAGGGE